MLKGETRCAEFPHAPGYEERCLHKHQKFRIDMDATECLDCGALLIRKKWRDSDPNSWWEE